MPWGSHGYILKRHKGICLRVFPHLRPGNGFIQCHCSQTPHILWNISQWVCYNLWNQPLPDTFISVAVRSICFCLSIYFLVLTLSCEFAPLPVFVLSTFTPSLSHLKKRPPLLSSSWSLIIRQSLLCSAGFRASLTLLNPSHLFVRRVWRGS